MRLLVNTGTFCRSGLCGGRPGLVFRLEVRQMGPMPVDPQAQTILDEIGTGDDLDYDDLPVEVIREGFEAVNDPPPPAPVDSIRDIEIPGRDATVGARVYSPTADDPLPALVYFHGGGFVTGSIASHDSLCRALAVATPCAVVSVDYRLAPEHRYPAAAEDCYAAVSWLADHGAELGIDAGRIAVGGDSAGGNMAAVTAQMCRDRGGPALRHQLLIYPVIDARCDSPSQHDNATGYLLTRDIMRWFWRQYLGRPEQGDEPTASPSRAAGFAGLAPATVMTAEFDPLRDEGEAYAASLESDGVATRLIRFDGQIHGFMSWAGRIDRARDAIDEATGALRTAFA